MDKMIFDTGNVVYLRTLVGIGIAGVVIRIEGIVNSNVVAFKDAIKGLRNIAAGARRGRVELVSRDEEKNTSGSTRATATVADTALRRLKELDFDILVVVTG